MGVRGVGGVGRVISRKDLVDSGTEGEGRLGEDRESLGCEQGRFGAESWLGILALYLKLHGDP